MSVERGRSITPDREECFERLRQFRFGDEVTCPHCRSELVWEKTQTGKGAKQYRCRQCERSFNDLTGTIFAHRRLDLEEMFYIIENVSAEPTGEIARDLGRDRRTIRSFEHELQQFFPDTWFNSPPESLADPLIE